MTDIETLQQAVPRLLRWFRQNKRDLPWRHNRTFYTSLVAELMLQQTRVEAVKEKYVAFLEKFPTERELALASEDEVMKAWEGLGYYTRARNLKRAAETLFREGTPQTWVGVNALAGVGNYTAGALSSIALGLKEPAVDGNVLRILTRFFADDSVIDDAAKRKFTEILRAVYPDETADFCEGLMELGAIVCVPNGAPLCEQCPWNTLCRAHLEGREEDFPVRAEKRPRRVEYRNVYVLKCGGKYAIRKREEGLLKGLWEFPNEVSPPPYPPPQGGGMTEPSQGGGMTEPSQGGGMRGGEKASLGRAHPERSEGSHKTDGGLSIQGDPSHALGMTQKGTLLAQKNATHVFTHVEWRMTGYLIETAEPDPAFLWATAEEIRQNFAIPSAFKAFRVWLK